MFDTPKPLFPGKESNNQKNVNEPQDIFEKVDSESSDVSNAKNVPSAGAPKRESFSKDGGEVLSADDDMVGEKEFQYRAKKSFRWKGVVLIIFVLVLIGVSGVFGARWYFKQKNQKIISAPSLERENAVPQTEEENPVFREEEEVVGEEETPSPRSAKDSDSDGLTDQEEVEFGTNPRNYDSDQDKLFDFDEVRVYQTDPTNKDTDGDSFLDGEEVKNGYNPKGSGKLFEIPKP